MGAGERILKCNEVNLVVLMELRPQYVPGLYSMIHVHTSM